MTYDSDAIAASVSKCTGEPAAAGSAGQFDKSKEPEKGENNMTPTRRIMVLEFNELTPDLMHRFMAAGHLPHFQRLHNESHVYITQAAEDGWDLNPWVQWVTVHSGIDYREHGVTELDQGAALKVDRVWDVVSKAGLSVWICGSM